MNLPENINGLCIRCVITLAHFIWQGAAVALLAGLAGLLLRKSSPAVRYWMFLAAMTIMAVCLLGTFLLVRSPADASVAGGATAQQVVTVTTVGPQVPPHISPPVPGGFAESSLPQTPMTMAPASAAPPEPSAPPAEAYWEKLSPIAAGCYLLGVLLMLARLLAGLHGGRRLRRDSEPVTDPALLAMLARKARALGLRLTPAIACCSRVAVPIVVGLVRPMILLPLSMSAGLSPGQVEAVLAHELAHIRRLDPLVNLIQRLIETFLFYHPGVWFISRRIRVERENCCDDMAVAAGAERCAYAESLLHIARRSLTGAQGRQGRAAVGIGATDKPSLLRARIGRLLGGPDEGVRLTRSWPVALLVIAAVLAASALLNLRAESRGPSPAATQPAPATGSGPAGNGAADKARVVRHVYDVRDLKVAMPSYAGQPAYWDEFDPNSGFPRSREPGSAESRALRKKTIERENEAQLIEKIKRIDPGSWLPEAGIGSILLYADGVALVISQTPENHARISKLIELLRDERSLQVLMSFKFIHWSGPQAAGKSDALPAWLSKNVKAAFDEKTGLLRISDSEAEALLEHVKSKADYRMLASPRITLYNRKRAYVTVRSDEAILLPRLDKNGEKALMRIPTGAVVDIKTVVDRKGKSIVCDLATWIAESAFQGDVPGVAVAEAKAAFTVPDKAAMLFRVEMVKHKIEGARQAVGADGAAKMEVQHSPVEAGKQEKDYVYILISPQIIERAEAETQPAMDGPMYMPPAPAGAGTQPATQPSVEAQRLLNQLKAALNRDLGDFTIIAAVTRLDGQKESPDRGLIRLAAARGNGWLEHLYRIGPPRGMTSDPAPDYLATVPVPPDWPRLDARKFLAGAEEYKPITSMIVASSQAAQLYYNHDRKAIEWHRFDAGRYGLEKPGDLVLKMMLNRSASSGIGLVLDGSGPTAETVEAAPPSGRALGTALHLRKRLEWPGEPNAPPVTQDCMVWFDVDSGLPAEIAMRWIEEDGTTRFEDRTDEVKFAKVGQHWQVESWRSHVLFPAGRVVWPPLRTRIHRLSQQDVPEWLFKNAVAATQPVTKSAATPATQPAPAEPQDVHAAVRVEAAKIMLDRAKAKLADVRKAVENHRASDNDLARAQREVALDELGVKLAEAEARGDRAEDDKLRVQAAAVDKQYKDRILANVEKAAKSGAAAKQELEEARLDAKIAELGLLLAKAQQGGDAVEAQRLRVQAAQAQLEYAGQRLARVEALQKHNAATENQVLDARTDVKIAELSLRDGQAALDEVRKRARAATQPADAATSQSSHATAKIEAAKTELEKAEAELASELAAAKRPGMRPIGPLRDARYKVARATAALIIAHAEAKGYQAAAARGRVELARIELTVAKLRLADIKEWSQRNKIAADPQIQDADREVLAKLSTSLKMFEATTGRYPTTAEGLDALLTPPARLGGWGGPYVTADAEDAAATFNDPWGRRYVYRCPSARKGEKFDLYSLGPDGKDGTGDDVWPTGESRPAAPATQPAGNWGEAVQGVQVRLRAAKVQWKAGETPTLVADARNLGTLKLHGSPYLFSYSVQIDGQWFQRTIMTASSGSLDFGPGKQFLDTGIRLIGLELTDPTTHKAMELKPGKHTVRVAFAADGEKKGVRAVSNAVEIEIQPADTKAATQLAPHPADNR